MSTFYMLHLSYVNIHVNLIAIKKSTSVKLQMLTKTLILGVH